MANVLPKLIVKFIVYSVLQNFCYGMKDKTEERKG
jgi:hypothetical protein